MKRIAETLTALLLAAVLLFSPGSVRAEEAKRVAPSESFYGYANQDFFAAFDSGIEGAYAEPVYGELICPDPQTNFEYSGDLQMQAALDRDAAEVREKLFAGETGAAPGSPGRKILDLYDSLRNAEADREADDARFLEMIRPVLEAESAEALARAASDLYLDTGVNVLFEITAGEEKETNQELPMIRIAAPGFGARVAYDPEAEAVYAPVYREAMGAFLEALGLPVSGAALEEAYRLQTLDLTGTELYQEYDAARYSRAAAPGSDYSAEFQANRERIRALRAGDGAGMPEGLSRGDAAVYQKLVSTGRLSHIACSLDSLASAPSFPILSRMLEEAGFRTDRVIVRPADLEALRRESLTEENLEAWKINAAILLSEKLDYAPAAAADARNRMRRAAACALWGDDTAPETAAEDRSDAALRDRALALLPMEYALVWAEEKYDPALTGKTREMVEKIREAYIARIRKNTWLGEKEKETCVRKLESMEAVIGLPTEENYVFAQILPRAEGGSLLANRIRFAQRELQRNLRLVNEPGYGRKAFDQELFHAGYRMDMTKLNAGGNQGYNAIILPAWFLAYAVDPAADEVKLLGTLGAFIAHEMSHNFDQNGALYDENGALRNWWPEETYGELFRIRDRFEAHFEQTEIIRGVTRTFGGAMDECFADFSGITLVLDLTGNDPEAQRRALESWAGSRAFLYIASRAALEMKIEFEMFTPHPTGAQRINGIVSALDRFYDLYDVKEGDPMYTPPENRLSLW